MWQVDQSCSLVHLVLQSWNRSVSIHSGNWPNFVCYLGGLNVLVICSGLLSSLYYGSMKYEHITSEFWRTARKGGTYLLAATLQTEVTTYSIYINHYTMVCVLIDNTRLPLSVPLCWTEDTEEPERLSLTDFWNIHAQHFDPEGRLDGYLTVMVF